MAGSRETARITLEALVGLVGSDRTGVVAEHSIIATFDTHVIVEADQKLYKIQYTVSPNAVFSLGKSEPVYVQRVPRQRVAEDFMYGAVDALLTDRLDDAVAYASQLVPYLGEAKELLSYRDVAKRVDTLLGRDCSWKNVVLESEQAVYRGTAHFGKLYDGSMNPSDIAGFDELVRTEFGEQVTELETIWQTVNSLESVLKLLPDDKRSEASYTNLVEDYKSDLAEVRSMLNDVQHQVQDAAVLGRVSDAVAASMPKYRALCSYLQTAISR